MAFLTLHILRALPLNNLNRDQNGLPKSQFDGGIQRARLSSQSIKRPARIAFREAIETFPGASSSIRTMDSNAIKEVVRLAGEYAQSQGRTLDTPRAVKSAGSVVNSLAKKQRESRSDENGDDASKPDKKDNILLFSVAEFETLAQAIVDQQNGGADPSVDDFIQDFKSPSLDVAAFGRMFAAQAQKSTQAAIAVSHAVTTHEMSLTPDYFTAVDEFESESAATDAGAGHLGIVYYTSGVYYSTFTIDPGQLTRSWSGITSESARDQLRALVKALLSALPSGKLTNTNAHTKPFLVLIEEQRTRYVYEFETPVAASTDGGYRGPSIESLAQQVQLARKYDPGNYLSTLLYTESELAVFEGIERLTSLDEIADRVSNLVLRGALGAHP